MSVVIKGLLLRAERRRGLQKTVVARVSSAWTQKPTARKLFRGQPQVSRHRQGREVAQSCALHRDRGRAAYDGCLQVAEVWQRTRWEVNQGARPDCSCHPPNILTCSPNAQKQPGNLPWLTGLPVTRTYCQREGWSTSGLYQDEARQTAFGEVALTSTEQTSGQR